MDINNLYEIKGKEIEQLAGSLADNFFEDNLYKTIFVSRSSRRWALPYFFKHYLKLLRPYCRFFTDSPDKNCVMVIFDTSLDDRLMRRLGQIWLWIKLIPMMIGLHSFKSIAQSFEVWDMFTTVWTNQYMHDVFYHIEFLYTRKEKRHEGYALCMLDYLQQLASQQHRDITVETHDPAQMELYEQAGFKMVQTITHEKYGLTQYCMLKRNEE